MNKHVRQLLFGTVPATGAIAAHADPVVSLTLSGWTFGTGHAVSVTTPTYNGQAGGFKGSLTVDGITSNPFYTYCVELVQSFSFSASPLTGYALVDGVGYFGSATADRLGRLMTYVSLDASRVDTSGESTSLQLAIWNLIYDDDYTLDSGSFHAGGSYSAYANSLLSGAALTESNFEVSVLKNTEHQDFLRTTVRAGRSDEIPEPASLALAFVALAALGISRRRRTTTQD